MFSNFQPKKLPKEGEWICIFTAPKRTCGNVMFLHLSAIPVHRGMYPSMHLGQWCVYTPIYGTPSKPHPLYTTPPLYHTPLYHTPSLYHILLNHSPLYHIPSIPHPSIPHPFSIPHPIYTTNTLYTTTPLYHTTSLYHTPSTTPLYITPSR